MPFIGNQPALSYTSFAKQDFTTSATTSYTLDNPVANANELALFINFVRQEPTTAYSASGTSLNLTSATSALDDMYCVYLGKAVQTVNPPNGSVGTAQLASTAVTNAKIADDAVTKDKLSAHNYPAFEADLSGNQTVTDATDTKVEFDRESFDTDNCYDNSTNYRFTPNVAGKYFVYSSALIIADADTRLTATSLKIYKNGTATHEILTQFFVNYIKKHTPLISAILDMNGTTDYVEIYGYNNVSTGTPQFQGTSARSQSVFGAYRIGD